MQFHEDGNRSFVESPAGTMCFTTTIVPSPDYAAQHPPDSDDDMYGGQAADIFSDVVVRSHDQGRTWGDLTQICPKDNPHESNLAVDPQNDRHLFAMTRCQRGLTAGESETEFAAFGNPAGTGVKQGVLFESWDAGRSWIQRGMSQYYGHRGNVLFAPSGAVVVTHSAGGFMGDEGVHDGRKVRQPFAFDLCLPSLNVKTWAQVARVSLTGGAYFHDGAGGWTDGISPVRPLASLVLNAHPHSYTAPTVELSTPGHFLTAYCFAVGNEEEQIAVNGVRWHLEQDGVVPRALRKPGGGGKL